MRIIFFIFVILLFSQCDPIELPPDEPGEPVFLLSMTDESGGTYEFGGGVDGYRMFTNYEQDADSVYRFIGELKKEDLSLDTFPSIRFEISDFQEAPSQVDIDQALADVNGFYDQSLTGNVDSFYQVGLMAATGQACFDLPAESFRWFIDSQQIATGHTAIHNFPDDATREVTLKIVDGMVEIASITRQVSFVSNAQTCIAQISSQSFNFLYISASLAGGNPPYQYTWNTNPPETTQGINLPIDSLILGETYCVTVTDVTGCSSSWCGNILPGFQVCNAQFSYSTSTIYDSLPAPMQFSKVTVIYNDGAGMEYRSDLQEQPNTSFFDISDIEGFQENEFGDPTKKLTISFKCDLFSENGELIKIDSGDGTIGIAYPD